MAEYAPPLLMSADEFRRFIALDENAERLFEHIDGEVIDVSPGRTFNSEIGHVIATEIRLFCRERKLPCHTSGGDGAYAIGSDTVVPDFAFKPTAMSRDYPDPVAPLLAVEIISPTDRAHAIRSKREVYVSAGILYWEVYPEMGRIDVYAPGEPARTLGMDDTLDGGAVLPGFALAVRALLGETA